MISRRVRRDYKAYILAILLWILAAMAAMAMSMTMTLRSDMYRVSNICAAAEADAIARAALAYALGSLSESDGFLPDTDDFPAEAIRVGNGAFWLISGDSDEDALMDYGLVDLGGRLDLNTVTLEVLSGLEIITDVAACSIIDWRDSDDEITGSGAESDYYLRQYDNSYNAKNSNFETTLELRLLAGVDDEMLFGEDTNLNGIIDGNEDDGSRLAPDDNRDGNLDYGLNYLTTAFINWPRESEGNDSSSVDINTANAVELTEYFSKYVDASIAAQWANQIAGGQNRPRFTSSLQMCLQLNMTAEQFALVEGGLSVSVDENTMRLNINAAPSDVLQALGILDDADIAALITARDDSGDQSLAWILSGGLSTEKLNALAEFAIVGRSYQYSADILSVSANGRAFKRYNYVIDVSEGTPQVIYSRDITSLGWPLDIKILQQLKQGEDIDEVLSAF